MRAYRARACSLLGGGGYIREDRIVAYLREGGGIDSRVESYAE